MSDPLSPERTGDVTALGFQSRNLESDDTVDVTEEAQATAAEEEVPVEEPVEEAPVQEEPEPAEAEPPSILAQLAEKEAETPSEQAEITRLQQKNLQLEAALQERRKIAEDRIRQAAEPQEPQPEQESYLKSAYVQQMLRSVQDENPEQYNQTLVEIAKADVMKEVEAKEKAVLERLNQADAARQEAEQRTQVKQGIETAFNKVRQEGGLYAELVEEFQERGMDSHIGRKMQSTPDMFYSIEGAEDAVRSLESRLRSRIAQAQQAESQTVVQGTVASAGTGAASTRGVDLNEKPDKKTPEEQYLENVEQAGRRSKNLGFFGET